MKRDIQYFCMAFLFICVVLPLWGVVSQGAAKTSVEHVADLNKQIQPFSGVELVLYAKTFGGTVYVTKKGEMVYSLTRKEMDQASNRGEKDKKAPEDQVCVLKERLLQAKKIFPKGREKAETKVNYFIGNKNNWRINIPSYDRVGFGEVYKHIDLSLQAHGNNVEKIFTIHPQGKVGDIQLIIEGES